MFNKMKLMQIEKKDTLDDHYDVTKLKGFILAFLKRLKDADITGFGAQLAYFFLLALFPLLIFLLTLLPYLNFPPALVYIVLEDLMPEQVYTMIEGTIVEVLEKRNSGLLSIGIIGTIWSASNGVNALIKSLNRSYNKEETRPFLVARFVSVVFTLLLIFLIVVALVLPVFGKQIGLFLFSTFGLEADFLVVWNKFRTLLPPILIFSVLTLMYWILPNIKLYLKSVLIGALFATISWLLVSYAFSYYIDNFVNYSATYGSIGGIIILMLWLYLTGILLIVGGQLNAIMQQRREKLDRKNRAK
ncbi:YihY/virulence factor BrkB family protein [Rummeliibacillus sp. TYF005]|nr:MULTISPECIES: YihY/virulence factor BrkB family protein [unclassified Rummeliibacillus]RIJ68904.1 YihY/virulence factor BrkB family protein [Rummeliibacillus sp. POC4]RPJ95961.1 YihY/virulence factor BrkB family protein [Rummeliibacillus sp. TYF005]